MPRDKTASDEELVELSRSEPDPEIRRLLIGDLFARHQTRVALWCLRFTGDRESAADLAQEVFLKVYRELDAFRAEARFTTWLYSIARNHCLNFLKSRRNAAREVDGQLSEIADEDGMETLGRIERESSYRFLRGLMERELTATERTVMTLHYGEDVPLDALTRLLRLDNRSGAKAYIVSAKRKLDRALERQRAMRETRRLARVASSSQPGRRSP